MKGTISVKASLSGYIGGISGDAPTYTGNYSVTPFADKKTVLYTAGKRMTDNVTVEKIPYYEVTDPRGGKTLVIAEITE